MEHILGQLSSMRRGNRSPIHRQACMSCMESLILGTTCRETKRITSHSTPQTVSRKGGAVQAMDLPTTEQTDETKPKTAAPELLPASFWTNCYQSPTALTQEEGYRERASIEKARDNSLFSHIFSCQIRLLMPHLPHELLSASSRQAGKAKLLVIPLAHLPPSGAGVRLPPRAKDLPNALELYAVRHVEPWHQRFHRAAAPVSQDSSVQAQQSCGWVHSSPYV